MMRMRILMAVILVQACGLAFADVTSNPFALVVDESHSSTDFPWNAVSSVDTLQLAFNESWTAEDPNGTSYTVSSTAFGSDMGWLADASVGFGASPAFPDDSVTRDTGTLDIKFGPNYTRGRNLGSITVFIIPQDGLRRFYDFDFSYSTVQDPNVFTSFASVAEQDPNDIPPSLTDNNWYGTVITIEDYEGQISDIDTLRLEATLSEKTHEPLGWNHHVSTLIAEMDVELINCLEDLQGDLNDDCTVNIIDFALLASDWLKCTDPSGTCD
jgi:hypothetical protein